MAMATDSRISNQRVQPSVELGIESIPLVDARRSCPVVVENKSIGIADLPEGIQRTLLIFWNSSVGDAMSDRGGTEGRVGRGGIGSNSKKESYRNPFIAPMVLTGPFPYPVH
jgi:hypothetical protein